MSYLYYYFTYTLDYWNYLLYFFYYTLIYLTNYEIDF